MNCLTYRVKRSVFSVALATALLTGGGTFAAAALGVVPAALAQAQPSGSPPAGDQVQGQHGRRMGQLLMSLNLSDAQKTQIRAIMADAHKQNQNVTDRDERRANMKAAMGKIDTVLTPAQRTELHAKMDAMRAQGQPAHTQ
jgi:Spy/CpxP family protein refolding chaperone